MKKLFVLLLLVLFSLPIFNINVQATDAEIAGAKYQELSEPVVNRLPYGVTHTLSHPETSTSMTGYDVDGIGQDTLSGIVEPGKFYPQQVNVLEVPSNNSVKITSWANLNNNKWTLTAVREQIFDYEAKNPGWKVVAAVNADFFDISGSGNLPFQTSGPHVAMGEFYRTTVSNKLIGFTNDGTANSLIGDVSAQRTPMMLAVYDETGNIVSEFQVQTINEAPGANGTSVYFGTYDSSHHYQEKQVDVGTAKGYFVTDAELALPNGPKDFYGKGVITSTESRTLHIGQFAVVTNNPEVQAKLAVGVKIRAQYEYTGAYANATSISGCATTILKNGAIPAASYNDGNLTNRAPRTVVGKKADGTIVFMVIDGRQGKNDMYGADLTELAAIMRGYDVVDAYNLDGGGSSTMVIRKDGEFKVMNSPSDGYERKDSNCFLIVAKEPTIDYTVDVTENTVSFNAEVVNNNGHDIKDFYVKMNNRLLPITGETVEYKNLTKNMAYPWSFYYRDSNGKTFELLTGGIVKTLKTPPLFNRLEVEETATDYILKVVYQDPDEASLLSTANIKLNEMLKVMTDGTVTFSKAVVGDTIDRIDVTYTYNINQGLVEQSMENIHYAFVSSKEAMALDAIYIAAETAIAGIYR